MTAPRIIVLTGIQGAGKSTIGPLLASRFERGAFVDGDDLHWMIVSGQAWVTEPGAPIEAEAAAQLRLRLRNACLLAKSFRGAGFTTVICDIILGERMNHLREDLRGIPFYLVVLAPDAETVIEREAGRGKKTVLGPEWAYYLDGELRNTMPGVGVWIDNSAKTAEETVDEVLRRLDEGLIESKSMTPEIETYNRYIQEKIRQLHEAVAGLSEEDLNRAPDLPRANTPYVIVTHTLGNIRAWVLGIVCALDLRRDRPAEFASRGGYEDLRAAASELSREVENALEGLDPATLDDRFVPAQELWGEGQPREIARRDGFAHVLEHAGIHLGHIQMTLELLRR